MNVSPYPIPVALLLAVTLALAACRSETPATGVQPGKPKASASPRVRVDGQPGPGQPAIGAGSSLIGDAGASLIGDAGASLLSNNGGSLIGKVKIPSGLLANNGGSLISDKGGSIVANNSGGLISDKGGSLISNNGGGLIGKTKRQLLAVAEAPAAGFTVTLVDAGGTPFKDPQGRLFQATTDATGAYAFARTPQGANLVVRVDLPPAVGPMLAYLPDAAPGAARQADVDGTSTLVMGYILDAYVRPQAKPRDVLGRLPAEAEATTRSKVALALGDTWSAERFTPQAVRAAVGSLRARDVAVDGQFDYVKSLLVAGQVDLGDGLEATKVSLTFPWGLSRLSDGSLLIVERNADRVRRRWPDGHLTTFAGKSGGRTLGDGGLAVDAYVDRPYDVAVNAQDDAFIADFGHQTIRKVDGKTGIITTVAGSGLDPTDLVPVAQGQTAPAAAAHLNRPTSVAIDAQGRPVFETNNGTYRLEADGQVRSLQADNDQLPDTLTAGPDGTIYGYHKDTALVSKLVDNTFTPLAGVPAQATDGAAHLAVAPDGAIYLAGTEKLWAWDQTAWRELPLGFRHVALKGLLAEANHLILSDSDTNQIWQVPRAGGPGVQIAGLVPATGDEPVPPGKLGLNRPTALTIDPAGNLYVADGLNNVVWKRRPDGLYVRFAGKVDATPGLVSADDGPAAQTPIAGVLALTALPDGQLIVIEGSVKSLMRMRVIATDGTMRVIPFPAGVLVPVAVAPDAQGALLITDLLSRQIVRAPDLAGGEGVPLAPEDAFSQPGGLVAAPDGTIYVSDTKLSAVLSLKDGVVKRIAGGNGEGLAGDGGQALQAQFNYPFGLALDAEGRLYVADSRNDRVRRIDLASGVITTVVGPGGLALTGTEPDASLKEPFGLALDAEENLYISDSGHNQVKLVKRAALR